MASKAKRSNLVQPKPHFMSSTEASRAQNVTNDIDLHYGDKSEFEVITTPRHNQFIRRATQRITSLSARKRRENKTGESKLNISSPILQYSSKASPVRLPSRSSKLSSLPEPVKREPLDSPTANEKPLPSLPVATVSSRSPIQRRSLIDATERPLRKSLSPNVIQDWPTLSPDITNSKTDLSKTASEEHKSTAASLQQSSISESVIERMRKLNLNTMNTKNNDDHFEHENQERIYKVIPTPGGEYTDDNIVALNSSFLDPRVPPRTPSTGIGTANNTPDENIETEVLTASHSPEISKACQPPCDVNHTPACIAKPLKNNHLIAASTSSNSYIPRPSRLVLDSNDENAGPAHSSPNLLQLRRKRMRIEGNSFDSPSLRAGQKHIETYGKDLSNYTDRASVVYRQSSLPLPGRLIKHNRIETTSIENGTFVVKTETKRSDSSNSQASRTNSEASTTKHDPSSNVQNLKPAQRVANDNAGNDDQSVISRSRSVSSATSGTIYAYDEFGSYRLKPVSTSDRKNGPRVRIDDVADSLLLDDKSLAICHAKRKAYENRYKTAVGDVNTVLSSDLQTSGQGRSLEQSAAIKAGKMEDNQVPSSKSMESAVSIDNKTDGDVAVSSKVAPPIPVNIPGLSHSSTGWPLLVSRVAPFADIAPGEWISKAKEKRKSASESDMRSNASASTATPVKYGKASVEQSPASAYTLRTALNSSLFGSTMQRPHRSVRARTTTNDYDSPLTQRTTGLRKTSNALNKSYASQRAAFKSSPPAPGDTQINYAAQVQSILASTPTYHARNSKINVGGANSYEVKNKNSSSSLPTASGSLSTGKAVMSNIKGLFHKQSNDKISKSTSHGSLRVSRETSVRTPSVAFKPSPLRTTFNPNSPDTDINAKGTISSSGAKRKFPLLHRDRGIDHLSSSQNDTSGSVRSVSPQPFVTSALEPFEIRDATALAFVLLDKARDSASPDTQQDCIALAKLLVATVSLSRESEKAMEEAQQAAARAEMEALKTRRSITEIVQKIQEMLSKQTAI